MGAQWGANDTSYLTGDYISQLNKYFDEQAMSNKNIDNCDGVLGRAKKALQKLENKGLLYSQSIGPEKSKFRTTISTKNLSTQNSFKTNSELIGEAMKHWVKFAESVSMIGSNGAKVFVQINEEKAIVDFCVDTEELLSETDF